METLKKLFSFTMGEIYVPPKIYKLKHKLIHISDTPIVIHKNIINLSKKLFPDFIIHTGDVVDDLKLEYKPYFENRYKKIAENFLNTLSLYVKNKIILVPGNHDKLDIIKFKNDKFVIKNEGENLLIVSIDFCLAHKIENLSKKGDFFLYGHDSIWVEDTNYLNGLNFINIIDLENKDVLKLPYPLGTNLSRLNRLKIGF